jgi:hypothetical protein
MLFVNCTQGFRCFWLKEIQKLLDRTYIFVFGRPKDPANLESLFNVCFYSSVWFSFHLLLFQSLLISNQRLTPLPPHVVLNVFIFLSAPIKMAYSHSFECWIPHSIIWWSLIDFFGRRRTLVIAIALVFIFTIFIYVGFSTLATILIFQHSISIFPMNFPN